MAITVPGNPFGVDVAVGSAGGIGELHSAPQTVNGREQLQATLGQRVGEFGKAVEKWQAEIDQTRVQDASNQLNSAMLDLKYNKDTGWQTLQGKNALERPSGKSLFEETQESFKKSYDSIRATLGNPRQRAAFDELYKGMSAQLGNEVNVWTTRQQITYQDDVDRQTLESAIAQGMSTDPTTRNSGMAAAKAMIEKIYKRRGLEPDYSKGPGLVAAMSIEQMVDSGSASQARRYLAENKGLMSPTQIAKAEQLIQTGEEDELVQATASKIFANSNGSLAQALIAVNAVDQKIRSKVRTGVRQAFSDVESIRREQNKERRNAVWSLVLQGQKVPTSMMQEMFAEDIDGYKVVQNYLEKEADGGVKFSDQKIMKDLEKQANDDPQGFKELDIRAKYGNVLTASDIRSLQSQQRKVDNVQFKDFLKAAKDAARIEGVRTTDLPMVGIAATRKWDEWMAKSDKVPSPDDQKRMIKALLSGSSDGLIWDSELPQWRAITENPTTPVSDLGSVGWYGGFDETEVKTFLADRYKVTPPATFNKEQKRVAEALYSGDGWPTDVWNKARERCKKIQAERRSQGKPDVPMTNAVIEAMAKAMIFEGVK
jgi:hypothetical protein